MIEEYVPIGRESLNRLQNERYKLLIECDRLAHQLALKNATELSYYFENGALHDMAQVLAAELEAKKEQGDRYRKLLERMLEEWDRRGKHEYKDGAPAIIFDIRDTVDNGPR